VLYIKARAGGMAGAWFIYWPVRGLYGPVTDNHPHCTDSAGKTVTWS